MRPLAITGVGTISPLGEGPEALLAALDAGRSGLTEAPAIEPGATAGWAGRIASFDSSPYITPMKARRLDRGSLFAVAAARQAIAVAGLAADPALAQDLGVLVGTSSAGSGPVTSFLDALFRQSPEAAPPFEFPNTVMNAPASHVSIQLGLQGPNVTLAHGEAVIATALLYGGLMVGDGRCSRLLAGAVDEWNPYYQAGYEQLGALRHAPAGGGGSLLTEGATLLLLEAPEEAARRGARVLARVRSAAVASAAGEPYRWVADAAVLSDVISDALDKAGLAASQVGSVFLAANGVEAMEEAEAEALAQVFAGETTLVASGVKGALGERAVAGATSLAVAALSRGRGLLPPFAGSALARWPASVEIASSPTPLPPGATLVVLCGVGGNYAAVVLD